MYILNAVERQKQKEENENREAGDPRIIWEMGCKSFVPYVDLLCRTAVGLVTVERLRRGICT